MKKTFSKFLATAAAVSMLASVSTVVNADVSFTTTECEHGVIITGTNVANGDELEEILIPDEIDGKTVVGIEDFAFADLDILTNIYIPVSVKDTNIGNCAFITKKSLIAYLEETVGADATKDDVIAYIAETFNYDIAKTEAKVMEKAALAGVTITEDMSVAELAESAAVILKSEENLNLSADTADKLAIWKATLADSKIVTSTDPLIIISGIKGDANNDGFINVRDAAAIAAALANGTVDNLAGDGDFNGDDVVNVRDAAAIAAALANGTL